MVPIDRYQYNDGREEPDLNDFFETDGDIFSTTVTAMYGARITATRGATSLKCRLYYAQCLGENDGATELNCEVIVLKLNDCGGYGGLDRDDIGLANDALHVFFEL